MIHVSLLTLPEAVASSLIGPYDVLTFYNRLAGGTETFRVELVGESRDALVTANGLPLTPHRSFDEVPATDIVYIPSLDVLVDEAKKAEAVLGRIIEAGGDNVRAA